MGIKLQSADIGSIKLTAADIDQVRLGASLVWSRSLMRDEFARADSVGMGSASWATHGPGVSPYILGVESGRARMGMPDGLIGQVLQTDTVRWLPNTTNGDDGYVEVQVGTRGASDSTMLSVAWRRCAESSPTHGVGISFQSAGVGIMRRVSGTNTRMALCGAFADGDILRLNQAGNVHTLFNNGTDVGVWNDSGATASKGSGFRRMAMTMTADKLFLGPRRFSTSFEYIECR